MAPRPPCWRKVSRLLETHRNHRRRRRKRRELLVRFPLGLDMFVHGYMKMTNIPGTMRYFDGLNVPHLFAWLAIIAEFFGGLGLMLGLLSRIAAFGLFCLMIVAPFANHLYPRFFMNWAGNRGGEGYEYHLLALALLLGIMLHGSGAFSIDRMLGGQPQDRR